VAYDTTVHEHLTSDLHFLSYKVVRNTHGLTGGSSVLPVRTLSWPKVGRRYRYFLSVVWRAVTVYAPKWLFALTLAPHPAGAFHP
jgi:hypothetical protein